MLAQSKNAELSLLSNFFSHLTSKPSENSIGTIFKIYPKSNHFPSFRLLSLSSPRPNHYILHLLIPIIIKSKLFGRLQRPNMVWPLATFPATSSPTSLLAPCCTQVTLGFYSLIMFFPQSLLCVYFLSSKTHSPVSFPASFHSSLSSNILSPERPSISTYLKQKPQTPLSLS